MHSRRSAKQSVSGAAGTQESRATIGRSRAPTDRRAALQPSVDRPGLSRASILALQSTIGNRAVQRLISAPALDEAPAVSAQPNSRWRARGYAGQVGPVTSIGGPAGASSIQAKPIGTGSIRARIQRILTRPQSVAGDLMHSEYETLFESFDDQFNGAAQARDGYGAVLAGVQAGWPYAYARLSDETLDNYDDAAAKTRNPGTEHMYVHDGDTIHTADRTDEKLPHPTLVGGNPDVTSAGTLTFYEPANRPDLRRITVTNESGHFRPPSVPQATLDRIQELANVDKPDEIRQVYANRPR